MARYRACACPGEVDTGSPTRTCAKQEATAISDCVAKQPRFLPIGIGCSTLAVVVTLTLPGIAAAAARRSAPAVAVAPPALTQDCSAFYDDYQRRGFTWGSGPGSSVGFGTFEGALPRYPENSFPNWYGACADWGRYSATGSARR
jgi:hypothetical protein